MVCAVGGFGGWNNELRAVAQEKTELGHPEWISPPLAFFHPLMALIPARNIVKQVEWHRNISFRVRHRSVQRDVSHRKPRSTSA
jgi:hypothetical protein